MAAHLIMLISRRRVSKLEDKRLCSKIIRSCPMDSLMDKRSINTTIPKQLHLLQSKSSMKVSLRSEENLKVHPITPITIMIKGTMLNLKNLSLLKINLCLKASFKTKPPILEIIKKILYKKFINLSHRVN